MSTLTMLNICNMCNYLIFKLKTKKWTQTGNLSHHVSGQVKITSLPSKFRSSLSSLTQVHISGMYRIIKGVFFCNDNDMCPPLSPPGCLPVLLFNQKKRTRVPLTSAPSENEFFSHSEFMASTSSAPSHSSPGEASS